MRGVMLVWIALTHLPTAASSWVNQPFGFVGAAEGFIFLSALFTGRIYFRIAEHDGYGAMTRKLWVRTATLVRLPRTLAGFCVPGGSAHCLPRRSARTSQSAGFLFHRWGEASGYGSRPAHLSATFTRYPAHVHHFSDVHIDGHSAGAENRMETDPVDIFRFLGTGPVRLSRAEHTFMMRYIPTRIPINEMGSFDLWAWQFLWFVGVWLGVRWAQDNLSIETWARRAAIPAVVIAVFCFIMRRKLVHGLELGAFEFLFDKWHLGPMRMLDFAAVAALLILSQPVTKAAAIRPLVLLGQSSLQVFCVHLLFCFAGLTLMGNESMLNGWRQFALLERDVYGDVNHSEDFLQERGQERTATTNTNTFRTRLRSCQEIRVDHLRQ